MIAVPIGRILLASSLEACGYGADTYHGGNRYARWHCHQKRVVVNYPYPTPSPLACPVCWGRTNEPERIMAEALRVAIP